MIGHEVVLASAGTGKTFALTNRYMELLCAGEDASAILATTFTKKAAGEITDRVLGRLSAATVDPKALAELREHVDGRLTAARCGELLVALVAGLDRLNIGTIDALFARLASGFALELGLGAGWRIMDDAEDERARSRAVEEALEAGAADETAELLEMMHDGGYARRVHGGLMERLEKCQRAYLLTRDRPAAWERVGPASEPLDAAALARVVQALEGASGLLARTRSGEVDERWVKAHAGSIGAARSGDWLDVLKSGLSGAIDAGNGTYQRHDIPGALAALYQPLIDHARAEVLARLRRRNIAVRELARRYDEAYARIKRGMGAYRHEDVPRLLVESGAMASLTDVYYRLDATVRHALLDEFQDTSGEQFRLLSPMLDELLSHAPGQGRSVFCVGDVKQSLYQWRDAEPTLLPGLKRRWPQLEEQKLDKSYRSSRVVLGAVNAVFGSLATNRAIEGKPGVAAWAGRFGEHTHAKNLSGSVSLLEVPADVSGLDAAERRELALRFAAGRVKAIVDACPGATVGVLVRANASIAVVIDELKDLKIEASEEGGNLLTDAPPVAAAVSLMQLADHPGDSAAAFHVATSPIRAAVGLTGALDAERAGECSALVRARLMRDGYAATLAWVCGRCAGSMDARGLARFGQLIELAEKFEARAGTRPSDFVRLVNATHVEEPGGRAVRVMTVHKAKGLEFDAVVMADLERGWQLKAGEVLIGELDDEGVPRAVSWGAAEAVCRGDPLLTALHERALGTVFDQELCCLYVGMTRAKHCLEMVVTEASRDRKNGDAPISAAGVLRCALADGTGAADGVLWTDRAGEWEREVRGAGPAREAEVVEISLRARGRPRSVSPSSLGGTVDAARLLGAGRAMERGALIHRWLEMVGWIEDGVPGDAELLSAGAAMGDARAAVREFRAVLERVGPALSRARYAGRGGEMELWRERPFAVRMEDAEGPVLMTGQFDRVVIGRRAGRAEWAEVLDFKTDAGGAAVAEGYGAQMAAYRRALSRMLGLAERCVGAVLVFASGEVQEVRSEE